MAPPDVHDADAPAFQRQADPRIVALFQKRLDIIERAATTP